jgi:hypothetical protein
MSAADFKNARMWMKAVGPKWFMRRAGIDWRADNTDLKAVDVTAYIAHANSLDPESLRGVRSSLPPELQEPSGGMVVDGPYGRDMHEKSALDTSKVENNWDTVAWTGDVIVACLQSAVKAEFVKPEHVAFIHCGIDRLNEIVEATSKAGYTNHQYVYMEKSGHSRYICN